MTGFQWAQALANPSLIVAGCGLAGIVIGIALWWLYRESDPGSWLQDELGPSWTVETPTSLREQTAPQSFKGQAVKGFDRQRRATK